MTPQEKAEELYYNYSFVGLKEIKSILNRIIRKNIAKQCALIAVQECIDLHHNLDGDRNGIGDSYKYWLEVKQEIEKL